MKQNNSTEIKSSKEIGMLAKKLNVTNQSYVLNTINAFLFCKDTEKRGRNVHDEKKKNTYKGEL